MTSKAKPTNMRVLQILLLLIIAVRVNSDGKTFSLCRNDGDCPQNATCVHVEVGAGDFECECDEKLYPFVPPVKVGEDEMILCTRRYMYLCMHVHYPCSLCGLICYNTSKSIDSWFVYY